jgi:hypothetical protein
VFTLALACAWCAVSGTARGQSPPAAPPGSNAPASQEQAPAGPAAARPWSFGGQIFADYYVVASHAPRLPITPEAPDDLEGRNGFWLRRVYLTYDHTFTPRLSTRIRLEANSSGDFVDSSAAEAFIKDAAVQWRTGRQRVAVGLVPTVSLRLTEEVWALRSVEKSPIDLYRLDSSRDLGLSVSGLLPGTSRWRYEAQVGNGAGVGSETNDAKSVRGALSMETARGLVVQGYADLQARANEGDWTTATAFAGWREARWRAGGLYAWQRRRAPVKDGQELDLDILSGFGVVTVHNRVDLFARVDRVFDPLPGARTIAYLPLSGAAPFTTWIAGVDLLVEGPLRLQPNVEVVTYDRGPGGDRAAPTVMPRVTVSISW